MNEFSHRNDPVVSGINAADRIAPVRTVPPQTPRTDAGQGLATPPLVPPPDAADGIAFVAEDSARALAAYSKIQTQIADTVAALAPPQGQDAGAVAQANDALLALMPVPSVPLPLPPADEDMVAFVGQVAQSIARQAAQTRAAHANLTPFVVDAAAA